MQTNWLRLIGEYMDPLPLPGREVPIYKPRDGGSVNIITQFGEFPSVPPHDRHLMAPGGGRELDLDPSDPEFLIVHKLTGMHEYVHCIPWDKVVDIVFYRMSG